MAQVTIYLPDRVAKAVRREARRGGKSVSAFITELLTRETRLGRWPPDLVDLLHDGGGDLEAPYDPPPEDVAAVD